MVTSEFAKHRMTTPLYPDQIDALPGVRDTFQTNRELQPIYESSARATALAGIASVGLKFAGSLAQQSGQGTLDRLTVSSDGERLMIFSLNAGAGTSGETPRPRVFGLLTDPGIHLEVVSDAISELIEASS